MRSVFSPLRLPAVEARRIGERQRPSRNRKEREQRARVRARTAKTGSDESTRVDLGACGMDEGFQPERRPSGLFDKLERCGFCNLGRERLDKLQCLRACQRLEVEA